MDDDRSDAKRAARDIVVGVWAAMTTPFDADGRMDLDAAALISRGSSMAGTASPEH